MADHSLVLALALTVRHDGHGGVADDLSGPEGLTAWVREHAAALEPDADTGANTGSGAGGFAADAFTADEEALTAVRALRAAVRALFARAVRPDPPSPADAQRLLPAGMALELLNSAAAAVPTVSRLEWPEGRDPYAVHRGTGAPDAVTALCAALARAAVDFLAGPDREKLRSCHAPRCVRYFLKEHPRQEWCGPSCGNRARVARHQRRHRLHAES
ncbi:CGNR zinc finger domain-containing protein [Streptomyces melanogenes]|uniref:ABATE domain-containing protein n=1 Tax=Streptomyces melanogenes TaxID=67326 RepID=A0ABZ1XE47_9ACTN|nr:ABATE domain-containing protein [Streptomyces melanogenes]